MIFIMDSEADSDYSQIKHLLYKRLSESGWCDQVRRMIRLKLRENHDLTLDELIDSTLPKARSLVPAAIKREMLQKLKDGILREEGYFDNDR